MYKLRDNARTSQKNMVCSKPSLSPSLLASSLGVASPNLHATVLSSSPLQSCPQRSSTFCFFLGDLEVFVFPLSKPKASSFLVLNLVRSAANRIVCAHPAYSP
mmetsp:Transcript_34287/g.77231  ORF Transcript_34287/g.77231 Transcript_34287/m.77231 type:complete len:103 (-) Transcript_34287:1155-1463(-)